MIKRETNVVSETRNIVSVNNTNHDNHHQPQATNQQVSQQKTPTPTTTAQQQSATRKQTPSVDISSNLDCPTNDNQIANFFWTVIDEKRFPQISIPYILKKNSIKYLSVRIIERVILSKYENNYSEEVKQYGSLISELCTQSDVALLNEINDYHVNKEYGIEPFTQQDTLVQLDDFLKFYEILSRTCRTKEEAAKQNNLRIVNTSTSLNNNNIINLHEQRRLQQQQQQQQQQHISQVSKQLQPITVSASSIQKSQLNVPDFVFNTNTHLNHSLSNRPNLVSNNYCNPAQLGATTSTNDANLRQMQILKQHQNPLNINRINQLNPYMNQSTTVRQQLLQQQHPSNMTPQLRPLSPPIIQTPQSNNPPTNSQSPHLNQNILINPSKQIIPSSMPPQHGTFLNGDITSSTIRRDASPSSLILNSNMNLMPRLVQSSLSTSSTSSSLSDFSIGSSRASIDPHFNGVGGSSNNRPTTEQYHNHLLNKQLNPPHLYSKSPVTPASVHSPSSIWSNQSSDHHHHQQNDIYFNNNSHDHLITSHLNKSPTTPLAISQTPYASYNHHTIQNNNITQPAGFNNYLTPTAQGSIPYLVNQQHKQQQHHYQQQTQLQSIRQVASPLKAVSPSLTNLNQTSTHMTNPINRPINPAQVAAFQPPPHLDRPPVSSSHLTHPNHNRVLNQTQITPINNNNTNNIFPTNNPNQSLLNSPTPPLTPTPNLPANNRLIQQQPHQSIPNLTERSTSINVESITHQKNQKQISNATSLASNQTNVENDDIIILDEPITEPIARPSKSRRHSSQTSIRSSLDTNLPNSFHNNESNNFGFIQLNDLVVPYIRLPFKLYRCCSQYQPSNIYIPWRLLSRTGLILKDEEQNLISSFESVYELQKSQHPIEFTRLFEIIQTINSQWYFDSEKILVINLLEFFSHCREALFLKQHKPGKPLVLNYKDILKMSGGIILLDIPDGPRDLLIFPFVNHNDLVLAPLNTFTNYIRHFDAQRVDYSAELLDRETYQATSHETQQIRHFLNLLLFYLTDNERRCKLPTAIRLINVKPWLDKHPDEFKILCRYTSEFPRDWIDSIEKVLIQFKAFTINSSTNISNKAINNSDINQINSKTEDQESLIDNKQDIEIELEEAQVQLENNIELKEKEQDKQLISEERNHIESISLSPSSMDSVTPSVSPILSSSANPITTTTSTDNNDDNTPINQKLITNKEKQIENERLNQVEINLQTNELHSESIQENINSKLVDKVVESRLSFDFDDVDENLTGYEMFKLKRRLSDTVLMFKSHANYYKQYLDEESILMKQTKFDIQLSEKLNELDEKLEQDLKKQNDINNHIKNEPNSPVKETIEEQKTNDETSVELNEKPVEVEEEKLEETYNDDKHLKNKRNASVTSISSFSQTSKKPKYSLGKVNDDGFEDISDSDNEILLGGNTLTPLSNDKKKQINYESDLFTSEEEFDESYYLKKFKIQECCVLLKDVGADAPLPKKRLVHSSHFNNDSSSSSSSLSASSMSSAGSHSSLKHNDFKHTRADSSNRKNSTNSTSSIKSLVDSSSTTLLQPLNFNQTTCKSSFSNNSKHKENKIGK